LGHAPQNQVVQMAALQIGLQKLALTDDLRDIMIYLAQQTVSLPDDDLDVVIAAADVDAVDVVVAAADVVDVVAAASADVVVVDVAAESTDTTTNTTTVM
jgi:AmiR/NasT family two-component response regulator